MKVLFLFGGQMLLVDEGTSSLVDILRIMWKLRTREAGAEASLVGFPSKSSMVRPPRFTFHHFNHNYQAQCRNRTHSFTYLGATIQIKSLTYAHNRVSNPPLARNASANASVYNSQFIEPSSNDISVDQIVVAVLTPISSRFSTGRLKWQEWENNTVRA